MHPPDDDLVLYRVGRLPSRRFSAVKTHIAECGPCSAKLNQLSQEDRQAGGFRAEDRRHHPRTAADQPVSVRVVRQSLSPAVDGRLIEVSDGGLKLAVPERFEPGALVQVRVENRFILAEVRHCTSRNCVFHVGLEIKDIFEIPR